MILCQLLFLAVLIDYSVSTLVTLRTCAVSYPLFGGAFCSPQNLRGQRTDPRLYYLTKYQITVISDKSNYYKGVLNAT